MKAMHPMRKDKLKVDNALKKSIFYHHQTFILRRQMIKSFFFLGNELFYIIHAQPVLSYHLI